SRRFISTSAIICSRRAFAVGRRTRCGHGFTSTSPSMKNKLPLVVLAGAMLCAAHAADSKHNIAASDILARVKILASDEFEGRGPGTPGEEKTINYLAAEFKKLGL